MFPKVMHDPAGIKPDVTVTNPAEEDAARANGLTVEGQTPDPTVREGYSISPEAAIAVSGIPQDGGEPTGGLAGQIRSKKQHLPIPPSETNDLSDNATLRAKHSRNIRGRMVDFFHPPTAANQHVVSPAVIHSIAADGTANLTVFHPAGVRQQIGVTQGVAQNQWNLREDDEDYNDFSGENLTPRKLPSVTGNAAA
jgi:hypothetical protein